MNEASIGKEAEQKSSLVDALDAILENGDKRYKTLRGFEVAQKGPFVVIDTTLQVLREVGSRLVPPNRYAVENALSKLKERTNHLAGKPAESSASDSSSDERTQ